jgi:hypothetical protein
MCELKTVVVTSMQLRSTDLESLIIAYLLLRNLFSFSAYRHRLDNLKHASDAKSFGFLQCLVQQVYNLCLATCIH